jgi:hypothetical protein
LHVYVGAGSSGRQPSGGVGRKKTVDEWDAREKHPRVIGQAALPYLPAA